MEGDENKTESNEKKTFAKNPLAGPKKFGEKTGEFKAAAQRA